MPALDTDAGGPRLLLSLRLLSVHRAAAPRLGLQGQKLEQSAQVSDVRGQERVPPRYQVCWSSHALKLPRSQAPARLQLRACCPGPLPLPPQRLICRAHPPPASFRFDPSNRYLVGAHGRNLTAWHLGAHDPDTFSSYVVVDLEDDIHRIFFMPDRPAVLAITNSGALHFISTESWQVLHVVKNLHVGAVLDGYLSADGSKLLTIGADGRALLTFIYQQHTQASICWHTAISCAFDMTKDGRFAACGDDDAQLKARCVARRSLPSPLPSLCAARPPLTTARSPYRHACAATATARPAAPSPPPPPAFARPPSLAPLISDNLLLPPLPLAFQVWDLNSRTAKVLPGHLDEIYACSFSPDARHLASSGAEALVYIWNLSNISPFLIHKLDLNLPTPGCVSRCDDLHFHPGGQLLAVGCKSALTAVQIWDPFAGKLMRTIDFQSIHGSLPSPLPSPVRVFCVRWSPDGSALAAAGCDSGLGRWSTAEWDSWQVLPPLTTCLQGRPVTGIAWAPSSQQFVICSGCWTGSAVVAAVNKDSSLVWCHEYPQTFAEKGCVAWSNDGGDFVIAGTDNGILVLSAAAGLPLRLIPSFQYKGVRVHPQNNAAVGVFCTNSYSGGISTWMLFGAEGAMCDWDHYQCRGGMLEDLDRQPKLLASWIDYQKMPLAMHAIEAGRTDVLLSFLNRAEPGSYSVAVVTSYDPSSFLAPLRKKDRAMLQALIDGFLQGKLMLGMADSKVFWPLIQGIRTYFPDIFSYFLKACPISLGEVSWAGPLTVGSCDLVMHSDPKYLWYNLMLLPSVHLQLFSRKKSIVPENVQRDDQLINMTAFVLPLPNIVQAGFNRSTLLGLIVQSEPSLPLEVYSYPAVRALVGYKWREYGYELAMKMLGMHLAFVAALSLFCIWLPFSLNSPTTTDEFGNIIYIGYVRASFACLALCDFIAIIFIILEVRQFIHKGVLASLQDIWNIMDVASFILIIAINPLFAIAVDLFSVSIHEDTDTALVIISSIESVLVWSRVLYFLLAYQATGPLVRMILQVFRDIKYFILLLVCTMIGFGLAFYVLFNSAAAIDDSDVEDYFSTLSRALISTFCIMVGMVDPSVFWKARSPALAIAMFCLYVVVMLVMLFNLLIAILSDTYEKVKETEEVEFIKGRARIIFELEANMPPSVTRKLASSGRDYLHFLAHDESTSHALQGDFAWAGRLKETEKRVSKLLGATELALSTKLAEVLQRLDAQQKTE